MQYIHRITLSDNETVALQEAIIIYKEYIREKIGDDIVAPYWARLKNIKEVEEKIKSFGVLEEMYLEVMEINKQKNLITDWLEENRDPEIDNFIEKSLDISEKIRKECEKQGIDKKPYSHFLTGMYNFSLKDIAKLETELNIKLT